MFKIYPCISGVSLLTLCYIQDPYMQIDAFQNYWETLYFSLKIINKYNVYIPLILVLLMKMAPEINGPLEYFYGFYLNFDNALYTLKNIFQSLGFFCGVLFVSFVIPQKLNKRTIALFYLVTLTTLIVLLNIISSTRDRTYLVLMVYVVHFFNNFALEIIY